MAQKRIITPTQVTQITQATNTLTPTQPQTYTPSLKATASLQQQLQAYYKAQRTKDKQTQTFLANYNDPTELNSYIDALTNREAVSKKFGEAWGTISTVSGTAAVLSFAGAIISGALAVAIPATAPVTAPLAAGLAKAAGIAAIPAAPAAASVTVEKGIKPIVAGKPKEAGLNMLMNLGETMDFAANPVKGLVLEGPEGFIKATGLSDEGRTNYDYDTGFFLADMLLEVVSDPMNWVDFGAGTALKSATKNVGEAATKQLVDSTVTTVNTTLTKRVGKISVEGAERITKKVSDTAAEISRNLSKTSFKDLTDEAKKMLIDSAHADIQRSLVNAIKAELPNAKWSDIETILRRAGRSAETGKYVRSALNQIKDITYDTLATDVIKGIAALQHYSDTFQKFMTKGAMMSSGYGLGVEFARKGWKGINAWANNYTLNKLKKATVFDNINGLDIKQYDKAKGVWDACYQYTTALTGEVSQRDINSFYAFMNQQLNRDKELISKILQDSGAPMKKAAKLDAQFKAIYNCDFKQYTNYLKGIDTKESGIYKEFVEYAEAAARITEMQSYAKAAGASIKTGTQLYKAQSAYSVVRLQNNVIETLQSIIKHTKKGFALTDRFYTVKLNNAYVNALLLNDPTIAETLMKIRTSKQIGAFLDKISTDINALEEHAAATISTAARTIIDAGASFGNINQLYNDIAGLAFEIKGISSDDFKRYIIDQILDEDATVSELLASFDNTTMPALMHGLEVMLYEDGFKFKDYPTLKEQIAGVYKRFLQAQQNANVERVGATIVEDFTQSVDDLIRYFSDYTDELSELSAANDIIRANLAAVKNKNIELLERIFTDKETIFKIAGTRYLADVGLALKTVAIKENLNFFDIPVNVSGHVLKAADRLGKRIGRLKKQFEQYAVEFTPKLTMKINEAYQAVREEFFNNRALLVDISDSATASAFSLLKETNNVYEQFAILNQFYKLDKPSDISKQFRETVAKHLKTKEYLNLTNPNNLLTTEFAWEAMAQSAWIAEKQFNETLINSITAYRNIGLASRKITNDFTAIKELVSANKLDRPFMLQQERYIKVATKYNKLLQFFEEYYDSLFDKQLAEQQIEKLREIMLKFPKLSKKYSALVDDLEKYWRGELTFEQDKKWVLKAGVRPDGTPAVDTFTPFWNAVKKMNEDIRLEVQKYNNARYEAYRLARYNFNTEEFKKRITKYTKLNTRQQTGFIDNDPQLKTLTSKTALKNNQQSYIGSNKPITSFKKHTVAQRIAEEPTEIPVYYGQFDIDEWEKRATYKFDKEYYQANRKQFDVAEYTSTPEYDHTPYEKFKSDLKNKRKELKQDFKKQYTLEELNIKDVSDLPPETYFPQSGNAIDEIYPITLTQDGHKQTVYAWYRSHITTEPYYQHYPETTQNTLVIFESFDAQRETYQSVTMEFFNDKEYVKSRQKYRQDYKTDMIISGRLKTELVNKLNTRKQIEALDSPAQIDYTAQILATHNIGEGMTIVDLEEKEMYIEKLKEIYAEHKQDLLEAYDFAHDIKQWAPIYNERYKEYLQRFNKDDQRVIKKIMNAVSSKQAYWYQMNELSYEGKKIAGIVLENGDVQVKASIERQLSRLEKDARLSKYKEIVEQKIIDKDKTLLGERNKEIISTRTQPFYEQYKQDYIQTNKEVNATAYDAYKKQLQAENQEIYDRYISELNEQNEPEYLQYLTELEQEEEYVETVYDQMIEELNKKNDELYARYREARITYNDVTPWDPIRKQQELNKLLKYATDQNSKGAFYNIFNLTPEQFNQELARRKRFITFKEEDIADKSLKKMFEHFNKRLKDSDVFYFYDEKNHRHWYVLKQFDKESNTGHKISAQGKQVYLDGNAVIAPKNKHNFDEFQLVDRFIKGKHPELAKHLNELGDDLELLTGSSLGDSQGEYFSKEVLQKVYEQMPEEVQEMFDLDEMIQQQFYDAYEFNESVLGSIASKNALGMNSGNMITNLSNTITHTQNYLKPKNEYVHTVFDSSFSIANPKGIYAGFSNEDLLAALQLNTNYKLVALVDDPKYGMRVREIYPTSIKAIEKAKELGAVVVPLQTYKDMYNVVNHRIGSTGFAKLWSRIIYAYKFGFLCRPGAWIRNFLDTNLKSKLEMKGESSTYNRMAHNILDEVEDMKDYIMRRSHDGVFRQQAIREWFGLETDDMGNPFPNLSKHLTYEQYIELERDFLSQGISGSIIQDLTLPDGASAFETFRWFTGKVLEPANKTENYNRLAMYLYELDKGTDYTSNLAKLAKTHFDYSFKNRAEQLAELIFPFTTFSLRNYSYWVEMLEKHPWIMRNYAHLMKPHWDFKDYTPEELARDYRVQNQIMYGQLKLAEFNDKVITFKANPSIQDALQMFSDPINAVYEKLAAPISIPLKAAQGDYTQPANLIPVVGPIAQAVSSMVDTGTPLPSAIGVSKAPRKTGRKDISKTFKNKNYNGMNSYRDKQYRTPNYRKNIIYDAYATKGITRYRTNFYPIVDIAHDVKMSYSVNVASKIKNKVKTDVYKGIRYNLRLDANKFK